METKTVTLPTLPQARAILVHRIERRIATLIEQINQNAEDTKLLKINKSDVETMQLRLKLIARCGQISLLRLNHLQEVFKHYCTHVFRIGKYMTFDRLGYELLHMTIERFFLFLRDFQLTIAIIDGKQREVIQKTSVITIFKKMASNSRELSFQEFIQSIQKLAILYWDEKEGYYRKIQNQQQIKQKRRQQLQRRKKRKEGLKSSNEEKSDDKDKLQEQKSQSQQQEKEKIKGGSEAVVAGNNENDDLVNQLMNDEQIKDPNQQVKQLAERTNKENAVVKKALIAQKQQEEECLKLTVDQKIQYFYQLINIDSLDTYKHRLTSLNLITFKTYIKQNQNQAKALSESKLEVAQQQEQERLQKLKAKMNQKKQKFKDRPLPKPSNQRALKQQENARKRKQLKKQRQNQVKQIKKVEQVKKVDPKKPVAPKVQYKDGQISWEILQKIGIDHLKMKQFNPTKLYASQDDDRYFLQEYGAKPRITSRLQARQRQSLSIVQGTRARAQQIQRKQKQKDKQTKQTSSFSRNKII